MSKMHSVGYVCFELEEIFIDYFQLLHQRWSPRGRPWPRGHILKSLASKVKSLASKPQVLENCPVLGSRTALFFEWLKFCRSAAKFFSRPFFWRSPEKMFENLFWGDRLKKNFGDLFFGDLFFWRTLAFVSLVLGFEYSCPWPRECLSSEWLSLAFA